MNYYLNKLMDLIMVIKFTMGAVEETIKSILCVDKEFSVDLFKKVLKKNIYLILSEDNYDEGVNDIIEKIQIKYDLSGPEFNMEMDDPEEIVEFEMEIPIGNILTGVVELVNKGAIDKKNYNLRDTMKDTNIIDEIWQEWNPVDEFSKHVKMMVTYLVENIEL